MIRQIAQLAAYSGGHHLNLLLGPAQHACEQRIAVWLNAFEHVDLVVAAKVFKFGVFGPGTLGELGDWLALPETERGKEGRGVKKKKKKRVYFVDFFRDVDESRLFNPFLPRRHGAHVLAKGLGRLVDQANDFDHVLRPEMRVIVRGREDLDRGDFKPPIWGEVVVRLSKNVVVVAHESFEFAPMNVVKRFTI